MRLLPALLLLPLAGLGLALAWLTSAEEPSAPRALVAEATAPAPTDAPPDLVEASLRGAATPAAATPADASLDPEGDLEPERRSALPDNRTAPQVRVVRGVPPQPVAGAELLFVTEALAERRLRAAHRELSRYEWPEATGQRAITGADGTATLPNSEAPWLCAARTATEFAFAVVAPRPGVQTMTLQLDELLVVAAVWGPERPAPGVPLAILQQTTTDPAQPVWRGTSDANGRVRIPHFQLVRQPNQNGPDLFAAMPLVPAATAVAFAGRPTDGAPITVTLPPLGQVAVHLVDHRGNPVLSPAVVGLGGERSQQPATEQPLAVPRGLLQQRADKPAGEAPVLLPFHSVGAPLHVYARVQNDRRPTEVGPLLGPAQPGELVNVTLPLASHQLLLAGRLVLPGDQPLADAEVQSAMWRADRDMLSAKLQTIADGRFDLVLPQRTDATEYQLEIRHELPATAEVPAQRLGARVRVPALRAGQRIELGTIVMAELPVLVSGVVVDDEGQPVADADVHVQQQDPPQQGQDPREAWHTLPLFRTRTATDGTFVVDGQKPPGTLRLRADTDRHFADSLPLHTQGQTVRIAIARNGILRGRVLLPDWLPDGAIALQLRPFDESVRAKETRSIDLSRRGRFTLEPLRPGRFDAILTLRNTKQPLLVLPDVFVQPGENRDGRFQPLDLRQSLHRFRLRAVEANGQTWPLEGPILAKLTRPDGTVEAAACRWQQGRCELITDNPTVEFTCFGRGLRTARLVLAAGDHDMLLQRLRPALVDLPGLRGLCGPQRKVRISAVLQGDTGLPADLRGIDQRTGESFGFARWDLGRSSGGWLGSSDTVEIPVLQNGKYQLLLRPHATDSERSPQGEVALGTFDLQADAFQPVRVRYDAVAVSRALQQLDERHAQALQQAQQPGGQPQGRPGNRSR